MMNAIIAFKTDTAADSQRLIGINKAYRLTRTGDIICYYANKLIPAHTAWPLTLDIDTVIKYINGR